MEKGYTSSFFTKDDANVGKKTTGFSDLGFDPTHEKEEVLK